MTETYKPVSKEEAEFLESYDQSKYPAPSLTADMVVFRWTGEQLQVLLIKRAGYPYKDYWALPGGFTQPTESSEETARRELEEETGVSNAYLEQLYFVSKPHRDPRGWVVSEAYMGFVPKDTEVKGGDDAQEAAWFDVSELGYALRMGKLTLAFDHNEIFANAISRLRNKVWYSNIAFNLLPEKFMIRDVQNLYFAILGKTMKRVTFRARIMPRLLPAGELEEKNVPHRQAEYYILNKDYEVDKTGSKPDLDELFPYPMEKEGVK